VPGKSNALNQAMPLLQSELVAFVDDDHRVAEDYLVEVCAAAETYPEAGLFCGRILPDWDGSEPDWIHDQGPYRIYPLPVPRFDQGEEPRVLTPEVAIPGGGNLFLRTSWLEKTGPFSTDLGPVGHNLGGSEDLDWVLRAQALGAVLQYVPTVVQYHYVNSSRFTVPYMMKKAYIRSASIIGLDGRKAEPGVPRYLYRKLAQYLFHALTAWRGDRRRFYLVRSAAALGEIKGHRDWKPETATEPAPGKAS
jgi:GT2 family glycosyltransferase